MATETQTSVIVTNKLELIRAVANGEVPDCVLAVDYDVLLQLCWDLNRPAPGTSWASK